MPVSYFASYELVSGSPLFDPEFYRRENPEVDSRGHDPVAHYLEFGARARRDPHPDFDSAFYLEQCRRLGAEPENPLIHYIETGAALGLNTRPPAAPAPRGPAVDAITLDSLALSPRTDGGAGIRGAGWLAASEPVAEIAVDLAGEVLGFATHGLPRPDVAALHPTDPRFAEAGFAFAIDRLSDTHAGPTELTLTATLASGARIEGRYTVIIPEGRAGAAPEDRRREALASLGAPPIRLQLDQATVDEHGILAIEGWAVALAPVVSLDVWLEGDRLGGAEFGARRDDVAETYPDYLNPAYSGFRFVTDTRAMGPGKRVFTVRCRIQGGVTRELAIPLALRAPHAAPVVADRAEARITCDDVTLTTDGRLRLEGWATCPLGIEAIVLFLDGAPVGEARTGIERPDVGNIFPEIPGSRTSGFAFNGPVATGDLTGEHVLAIRVRTPEGLGEGVRLPVAAVAAAEAPAAPEAAPTGQDLAMSIDAPTLVNGAAASPVRSSLSIAGWALAVRGVEAVDVAIDGKRVTGAYYGVRRDDVAAAFPDHAGSLLSGFAALLPNRVLPKGEHIVSLIARDKAGVEAQIDFTIQVEELEEEEIGPWSLRRRMPQSEIELGERLLQATRWRPGFSLLLRAGAGEADIGAARRTLASLRDQAYGDWRVVIAPTDAAVDLAGVQDALLEGFDEIAGQVTWSGPDGPGRRLDEILGPDAPGDGPWLYGVLAAGDELGVDALLAFATWSALERTPDLIYCDERRINPGTGRLDAFFKPDWSPDLGLSTNYIGRLWCARPQLLQRAGATLGELTGLGEYDLVLRLTEAAAGVGHIPAILCERSGSRDDTADLERGALRRALVRRNIAGRVTDGCAPGLYDIERTHATRGLVSIIMPTCAARGLVKTCIDTLRERTSYRNFEVICIENIPPAALEWRVWLKANADRVITTEETFNWSRFNNLAAAEARGEYLVFLNDDIEIISPDWLNVLLSHLVRPEVGVVGPLLLYPDRSIQHAGLFLSHMGTARHAFRFGPEDDPGYFGLALCDRNMIGVTGACLAVRRDTYDLVDGFDETHTVINNDVDFCLRVGERGLLNVFTPRTRLIHHELASRSEISDDYDSGAFDERWGELFLRGDPYFSPHLSKDQDDYALEREPVRVVYPSHPLISREKVRRLLVVKVDHIGDCVTALPAMRRLRALFPEARISVMAAASTEAIWSLLPGIDEFIPFQFFHTRSGEGQVAKTEAELAELRARLAPYRFDLAVDLRKSPDTRHLLQYSGARYRAGFGHHTDFPWLDVALEWEGDPKFQSKHAHVSDDLVRLVQAVELACDDDRTVLTPVAGPSPLPPDLALKLHEKRVVVIHPAAGTPTREWPAASFAQLIDLLVEDFDVNIAIIGGPGDQAIADAILDAVRHKHRVTSLLGRLPLARTAEFLPACALFVGNNSGPSHLAAALGVPTVAVHSGVIASEEWAPHGPTGVAIRKDLSCAPCYIATVDECHRRLACLTRLTAGEVLEVCRRFLALDAGRVQERTRSADGQAG